MFDRRVRQLPLPLFDLVCKQLGELNGGDVYDTLLLLSQIGITESAGVTVQTYGGEYLGELGFVSRIRNRATGKKRNNMKVYIFTQEQFEAVTNTVAELPGSRSFHVLTMLSKIAEKAMEVQGAPATTNGAEPPAEAVHA